MEPIEVELLMMGERIRKNRELLGMTRDQLSEKMGITTKFLSDVEYGYRGLSLKNLCKISQILGVSADYLLLGSDSSHRRLVCEVKYYVETV